MPIFHVISRDSGQKVDSYNNDVVTNTDTYPLAQYEHRALVDAPAPALDGHEPKTAWLIDLGPFFDRLNHFDPSVGPAIDLSTAPAVMAVRADFQRRKWIDLKDPRVAYGLQQLKTSGVHAGINDALIQFALTTPVERVEQLALLATYGDTINGSN